MYTLDLVLNLHFLVCLAHYSNSVEGFYQIYDNFTVSRLNVCVRSSPNAVQKPALAAPGQVSGVVVCEAGVTLQRLDDFLRLRGHMVPLDLGAKDTAALGGNVATNAGARPFGGRRQVPWCPALCWGASPALLSRCIKPEVLLQNLRYVPGGTASTLDTRQYEVSETPNRVFRVARRLIRLV